ncbi:MAG: MBL fold metallo-hydrolase, partial [Eubacteriales bacterium]|nr:MBL fold metallo-hydrolase [Eubacteriales bacterium]
LSSSQANAEVEVIATFHDPEQGNLRGTNKIHLVTLAGKRIAHCGDLGHALAKDQLARLQDLDLLLIPVGGHYTIDAATAAEIVCQTNPDVVVPMHYRDGKAGFKVISTVEPFLGHFDSVVHHDKSSFTLGEFHDSVVVLKNPKV